MLVQNLQILRSVHSAIVLNELRESCTVEVNTVARRRLPKDRTLNMELRAGFNQDECFEKIPSKSVGGPGVGMHIIFTGYPCDDVNVTHRCG